MATNYTLLRAAEPDSLVERFKGTL